MWNPTSDIADFCRSQEMTTTMTMTMNELSVLRTARMRRVVNKLKSVSVSSVIKLLQFVCYLIKIWKIILLTAYFTECCSFAVQISGNSVTTTFLICQQRAK